MSFKEFFSNLIKNGTIPYGNYGFATCNNDCGGGCDATIDSPNFMVKCFQTHLVDKPPTEGAYAEIISLYYTFEFTFQNGKWEATRHWIRPTLKK